MPAMIPVISSVPFWVMTPQVFPYAADDFLLMLRIVLKIRLHVVDQLRYSGVFIEEQVEEILVEPVEICRQKFGQPGQFDDDLRDQQNQQ